MKTHFLKLLCCAFLALSLGTRASLAQDAAPTLTIGSDVPAINVSGWWQDRIMHSPQKGKVYVIDFWASWCGPCRDSMPHLFAMKQKYANDGVEFAAISIDEDAEAATDYLHKLGKALPIYFAIDNKDQTWKAWGRAAGRNSIPSTFIVGKDGKIAWIGHPMRLEPELKKALAR